MGMKVSLRSVFLEDKKVERLFEETLESGKFDFRPIRIYNYYRKLSGRNISFDEFRELFNKWRDSEVEIYVNSGVSKEDAWCFWAKLIGSRYEITINNEKFILLLINGKGVYVIFVHPEYKDIEEKLVKLGIKGILSLDFSTYTFSKVDIKNSFFGDRAYIVGQKSLTDIQFKCPICKRETADYLITREHPSELVKLLLDYTYGTIISCEECFRDLETAIIENKDRLISFGIVGIESYF